MKRTSWSAGLQVAGGGTGVVAQAGSVAVRLLADRVGLTEELSAALHRRSFLPRHDRGRVVVDLAAMLCAGGEAIADIDTLRDQHEDPSTRVRPLRENAPRTPNSVSTPPSPQLHSAPVRLAYRRTESYRSARACGQSHLMHLGQSAHGR